MLEKQKARKDSALEQWSILSSTEPKIVINAGCGTGKTTILTKMAAKRMCENMAVITFTNAAADEIKDRLPNSKCFIGTIHKFSIQEIAKMELIYGFKSSLLKRTQIIKLLRKFIRQYELDPVPQLIEECISFITDHQQYIKENPNYPSFFNQVFNDYSDYKKQINAYDLTDAPEYLLQKIKEYDYNIQLDVLMIDEAQDLSLEQYELFNIINADFKFVIGDPKQSIYRFRGADGFIFDKLQQDGFALYNLTYNYRSYQEILDFANSGLTAIKGCGGEVNPPLLDFLLTEPQILCRTNYEVQRLLKKYPKVMTIHQSKGLEFDNVILVDFNKISDEDEAVYYVGLTRAKKGLLVTDFKTLLLT